MNTRIKTWTFVAGLLVVAFAAGWFSSEVKNVNKLDPADVIANRWMGDIGLLVANASRPELLSPETTQSIVRSGLNIDSVTLAQLYDDMSPALTKQLAFYIPSGRAIATTQPKIGTTPDRQGLLVFVDCMQKVRSRGGSVHKCFVDRVGGG